MMIVCPACSTRYDVPESAIGGEGRTVRCAQCRHSWFQPGPDGTSESIDGMADAPALAEVEAAAVAAGAPESAAASPAPQLAPSATPASDLVIEPSPFTDLVSEDPQEEPAKPRGTGRTWLLLVLLFLLLVFAIGGALAWFGAPDWLPIHRTALVTSRAGLALDFPPRLIERKTLSDGTEFFGARGTVTNTSGTSRAVPPIEIVLRDSGKRVVYRWEVVPPKRRLAPGESMTITEAVTDIPKSATVPEIGWKTV